LVPDSVPTRRNSGRPTPAGQPSGSWLRGAQLPPTDAVTQNPVEPEPARTGRVVAFRRCRSATRSAAISTRVSLDYRLGQIQESTTSAGTHLQTLRMWARRQGDDRASEGGDRAAQGPAGGGRSCRARRSLTSGSGSSTARYPSNSQKSWVGLVRGELRWMVMLLAVVSSEYHGRRVPRSTCEVKSTNDALVTSTRPPTRPSRVRRPQHTEEGTRVDWR
jgi:hypothetical protein